MSKKGKHNDDTCLYQKFRCIRYEQLRTLGLVFAGTALEALLFLATNRIENTGPEGAKPPLTRLAIAVRPQLGVT